MEEKPSAGSATAGAESPASAELPSSSRRRAGGQKRKANALSTPSSSSTPSKRLTREKAAMSHPPGHNGGPLTRARQSPSNLASPSSSAVTAMATATAGFKLEDKVAVTAWDTAAAAAALEEEVSKLEELKAAIEAEFEGIRSRDCNAHVVPSHCGWFSWTKLHLLEERALPSFFNGKSQIRTPDTYMEIRNWIVKKFHTNPNIQIESKDLAELEVADLDAKQEVLEFLDYWGLINFHPFPQIDSAANADGDGAAKEELEKLFHFEAIQPYSLVPKPSLSTPAVSSRLFPESSIAEELVRSEGPSVEYHCNSCSADCSRKRYHCQKQADYDLCAECFNNGKFASNMSSSDFILMEPAEAPGLSGGKWTDQETLLLLEALELYKENWNEIAEHVATKTKAQCILHFVQMPIEDAFFDSDDNVDGCSKETTDQPTTINDTSAPKDGTETGEDKTGAKEDQTRTSPTEALKPEDATEEKIVQRTAISETANEVIIGEETSKLEDTNEAKAAHHTGESLALKALNEAFEAVGCLHTPENRLSFAEVGNPVIALAAFLARLVERDIATASARSSLKSLNSDSPGLQLAARHCFFLEDPPDDQKVPAGSDCSAIEMANQDAQNNQEDLTHKGNNSTSVLGDRDLSIDHDNEKIEDPAPEEKQPPNSAKDKSIEKLNTANESCTAVSHEEVEPNKLKESSEPKIQKEPLKESNEMPTKSEFPSNSKEKTEGSSVAVTGVAKDVDMVSELKPSENNKVCLSVASVSAEEPLLAAEISRDIDMISDCLTPEKNEQEQHMKSNSIDHPQPSEAPKDVDMLASEAKEPQQPVALNSVVKNGATKVKDQKDSKKEKPDCKEIKDDQSIDKIKCAAVSALSAAAVKAKLLANQEEDQIRQLAATLIEKQLQKLEMKLAFFKEMDHVIMRVREQLDRSRQRLYHERAQIIAARLGLPASSSRGMPPTLPTSRIAMNFANSIPRPNVSMTFQRPPISRPMGTLAPTPSNPFVPTTAGGSIRPSGQDKLSSVGTK